VLRTVSFEIVRAEGGAHRGDIWAVTPCVDGAPLATLVEAYERARGYHPAGGYGGLILAYFNYGSLDEYLTVKNKSDYWRVRGESISSSALVARPAVGLSLPRSIRKTIRSVGTGSYSRTAESAITVSSDRSRSLERSTKMR
jgi:hypothetical protein